MNKMINPQFINELLTLKQISKVLLDKSLSQDIVSNLNTMEETKFMTNISATLRNTHNLLNEYLSKSYAPDEYLCNPNDDEIFSDCAFDNPKVQCDRKNEKGEIVPCKEACPFWKKFKDVKKLIKE